MARPRYVVYKGTVLPDTVHGCRELLKTLIDKLEVKVEYGSVAPGQADRYVEPFLRVPEILP